MNATGLLRQAKADGVRISLNHDGTLDYCAPRAVDARWLPLLREHKAEIVALLAATMDTQRWWQGSIEGRSVQPQPHAAAVLGHKAPAMTAEADDLLDTPKAHKPDILAAPAHPDPLPPLSPAAKARRRKVLATQARDGSHYAVLVEDPNTDPVIMALATPDGTCDVLIPKDRYDPFAVLATVQGWEA